MKNENNMTIRQKRLIKKIIIDIILLALLAVSGYYTFNKSFKVNSEKSVKYSEKSNVNFKVRLNKNEFYEDEYLDKNMLYVASLINNITVDFDYNFACDENEDLIFSYNIVAKLTISNKSSSKSFYEKEYVLLSNKNSNMINSSMKNIHEQIKIDYPYYNKVASDFKTRYGLEAESKLTVYMTINKRNMANSNFKLNNSSDMNVVIPLSERAIDIKLDYKEINQTNNIIENKTISINNIYYVVIVVVISIFVAVIITFAVYNFLTLVRKKKSRYDKFIGKILKEYDRLIAESSSLISFNGKEVVKIGKFTELLDIHDNVQLPIMYFEKEKHKHGYFYISHEKTVYLFEVSDSELKKGQK